MKKEFNESVSNYYQRETNYTNQMEIYKESNYVFCTLNDKNMWFVRKIDDNVLEDHFLVLHDFPNRNSFIVNVKKYNQFEKSSKLKINEIWYHSKNEYFLTTTDLNGSIGPDTLLTW